jgi:hypothetical protein
MTPMSGGDDAEEMDVDASESDDASVPPTIETEITHGEFLQHMSSLREYIHAKHSRSAMLNKLMAVDRMCREERSESIVHIVQRQVHMSIARALR